ncbi:ABC transporter ATP-binding protein [Flexivirga meconopsidis]|uniref:ABC transporter ATP-binding protein n=1 Tax=Flexivirga meconopsidis TaxID=2977121 RepID=UPI0022405C3A|nr:oligopeptide/dipeptide ABC transporter ATP-binding protein [Flexivirga meconopsidis]
MASPLLQLSDVHRNYRVRSTPLRRHSGEVHAVNGVDLVVRPGETVGIVGESGCGKSTLARLLVGLEQPTSGTVSWRGDDVSGLNRAQRHHFHRSIQLVFQDPHASLNPRRSIRDSVAEGILTHGLVPRNQVEDRVTELLSQVGLNAGYLHRYPHELSGGQLQRIGIARALAVEPQLLVCDEPVSALDISIQAQVLNLLNDLKRELDLAIVFIAHDLDVVQHMADRIVTMYLGKVVESGPCEEVYGTSAHPYTWALLSATPRRAGSDRERIMLQGDPPSPVELPTGCVFHTRCFAARAECSTQSPALLPVAGATEQHSAACHFADEIAKSSTSIPQSA